ncbi:MAG: MFS transporter [Geminicoccaceae bacterium]
MMAVYSGVFAFAVGAGPYPGGLLAEHYGLAAPFYAFTVLGTLAAVVAWLRVPETKGLRLDRAEGTATPPAVPFGAQLRLLLAQTGFLLISVVSFSSFFARTGALFNLIPVLGKERLGLAPDQIGFGLGLISVLGLGLAYPSGMLVDRFGRKGVIVPATLISGLALLLFSRAASYSWFLWGCAAWAVASGLSSAAPAAYAADMAPPGMNAAAMSAYRMLSDSGYVVGPLLLGFAADTVGVDAALVGTATLLAATSLLFARFAPETIRGRGRAQPALAVQPPAAEPAIVVAAPPPRRDD